MYLKELTIKGFKSFADPASLHFEPGITVVVGPNGSGKSNVVDAVAWVLGAQGPRTVRSSKMEDVIFAGSGERAALGRAEVSLTIDNRAGELPGGLAEITITRTLFRSGDSEYAINGQACRLLDVQELLSDSGVGRQQHVIIGQGQLDQVLNARPEDRRSVIEEAAGVLKHRRRRERAERRLAATEENLERLGDLLREVRRQIRPLERQAAAARSQATLAEELRGLRLYLTGREIAALEDRRRSAAEGRRAAAGEEESLHRALADLDAATDRVAAELSASREEGLSESLARVGGLAERSRGLAGVLTERRRSLRRAIDASADVDVVSTLESEAARLGSELAVTARDEAELEPSLTALAADEAGWSDDAARYAAVSGDVDELRRAQELHAEARGRADPLRQAIEQGRATVERLDDRLSAAEARRRSVADEATELDTSLAALDAAADGRERQVEEARRAARTSAEAAASAEEELRSAERDRARLEARAEALAKALAQARGGAGAEVLAGLAGVLGTLGDVVEVDAGWERAFEAAVGGALNAVVVEGRGAVRQALERLRQQGASGAVLAVLSRWSGAGMVDGPPPDAVLRAPAGLRAPAHLPAAAELLRAHVQPRVPSLAGALDRLLAGVVAIGGSWREAVDLALERPELVIVTRDGDRFAPSAWTVRGGESDSTPVAVAEAAAAAEEAGRRAEQAGSALRAARQVAEQAAAAGADAAREAERSADQRQSLDAARRRVSAQLTSLDEERAAALRHRQEVADRLERDAAGLAELEERLPTLDEAAATAAARIEEAAEERRRLDRRRQELNVRRRDLEVRAAGLAERRAVLVERLRDVERRLEGHAAEREQAAERRRGLERDALVTGRLAGVVERTGARLDGVLGRLSELRSRQLDELRTGGARLDELRRRRAETDQQLTAVRDRAQRLDLDLAETAVRLETAVDGLRRDLGCEPEEAVGACRPDVPDGTEPEGRAAEVEKELNALGPVNPLALEELGTLEDRHRFLDEQVADVRRARRELQQVITAVDDEIMRVFAEAFADVNEHFQVLVATLFPGGIGRLSLTDPGNLLDTGVEIEARPAGKNVRRLTLLSGGERSLVALAFLFAVFRSRPSPFYLMDEVEAALDDVNLHRFLDLLHEFRGEAQLIIVSHQKRTMEAADALYGVTMQAGGASKVVSQKVRRDTDGEQAAVASGH